MITLDEYIKNLQASLASHFAPNQIYYGKEGAKRLAREVGYGLGSYTDEEVNNVLGGLYSTLLVRFTFSTKTGVPIDNKEFIEQIKIGINNYKMCKEKNN